VHLGKYLSDTFPIQNGLKQGDALLTLLLSFALEYATTKVQENVVRHISFCPMMMIMMMMMMIMTSMS
jgi:hypothetical protein